jgi:cytochrome P450
VKKVRIGLSQLACDPAAIRSKHAFAAVVGFDVHAAVFAKSVDRAAEGMTQFHVLRPCSAHLDPRRRVGVLKIDIRISCSSVSSNRLEREACMIGSGSAVLKHRRGLNSIRRFFSKGASRVNDLDRYSLFDPEIVENPFAYYALLREEAPVHRTPMGFHVVSSYALCVEAMRDPEAFSSRFGAAMGGGMSAKARADLSKSPLPVTDTLLTNDPPSHTRFRKLVNKAFSPRRVQSMEAYVVETANDLIDGFAERNELELVEELAVPLPLTVIADQLGVPRADMGDFKKWSDASVAPLGGMISEDEQVECAHLVVELQGYLADRIEQRRARSTDDLLSDLVHASVDGETRLTTGEVISIAQQFLVAGNETTTNLIAASFMYLLRNSDQLERLRADPTLVPNAVEETLRCETPVQGMWRVATRDLELGGEKIPKGSFVMLRYAAANRDPAVFDDPERFDVGRENAREHLSFGRGIHFCPGAALGRKEAVVALSLMLDRFPSLHLSEGNDFAHQPSMLLRGLKRLDLGLR